MTLSERMVEAAARAAYERSNKGLRNVWGWEDHGLDDEHPGTRERYLVMARAALTAALAVAEEAGAGVFVVPDARTDALGQPVNGTDATKPWSSGHNACRAATLAGRVTL